MAHLILFTVLLTTLTPPQALALKEPTRSEKDREPEDRFHRQRVRVNFGQLVKCMRGLESLRDWELPPLVARANRDRRFDSPPLVWYGDFPENWERPDGSNAPRKGYFVMTSDRLRFFAVKSGQEPLGATGKGHHLVRIPVTPEELGEPEWSEPEDPYLYLNVSQSEAPESVRRLQGESPKGFAETLRPTVDLPLSQVPRGVVTMGSLFYRGPNWLLDGLREVTQRYQRIALKQTRQIEILNDADQYNGILSEIEDWNDPKNRVPRKMTREAARAALEGCRGSGFGWMNARADGQPPRSFDRAVEVEKKTLARLPELPYERSEPETPVRAPAVSSKKGPQGSPSGPGAPSSAAANHRARPAH